MKTLITALLISFVVAGCSNSKTIEFEGFFTYGHEVSAFQSCNDSKSYWLSGQDMQSIEQASLMLARTKNAPYQPIYIKFLGSYEDREMIGFEDNYDGLIYLDKLLIKEEKAPFNCK